MLDILVIGNILSKAKSVVLDNLGQPTSLLCCLYLLCLPHLMCDDNLLTLLFKQGFGFGSIAEELNAYSIVNIR